MPSMRSSRCLRGFLAITFSRCVFCPLQYHRYQSFGTGSKEDEKAALAPCIRTYSPHTQKPRLRKQGRKEVFHGRASGTGCFYFLLLGVLTHTTYFYCWYRTVAGARTVVCLTSLVFTAGSGNILLGAFAGDTGGSWVSAESNFLYRFLHLWTRPYHRPVCCFYCDNTPFCGLGRTNF